MQLYSKTQHYQYLRNKERAHLDRLKVLMRYSNPQGRPVCNECGEQDIEVLCLDHINGGGNRELKALGVKGNVFYHWLAENDYPEGYQVLCANCNMRKARLRRERTN